MRKAKASTNRRMKQRGTAMVEMALILPVYFLLVYGTIQFCWVMFGYCNATYACRQAARYAAVHGTGAPYTCTSTDVKNVASQYLWGAPKNGITINSSWPSGNSPNHYLTVTISLVYPTGIPFSSISSIIVGTSATEWILQ